MEAIEELLKGLASLSNAGSGCNPSQLELPDECEADVVDWVSSTKQTSFSYT